MANNYQQENAVRQRAEKLFVAHNRANGALYPYGFGFLSAEDRKPWMEKARAELTPVTSEDQKAALGNVKRKPMQRDMFTGNLVKTKPKAGRGDHIVLKGDEVELPAVPGMAHFAGSGPNGKRCEHCTHLGNLPSWGRKSRTTRELAELNENAKPRRIEANACRKAAELFGGFVQKGGIQFQQACKYFEER